MRRRLLISLLSLVLLLVSSNCGRQAWQRHYAQGLDTRVYIVRHGEKELTPGLADPPLTAAGQQRALALRDSLKGNIMLSGVFSTATSRTRSTAQPLADKLKLPVQTYDARQLTALVRRIRQEYRGRAVLVVGHSNTILETVEALGAARPLATVGDGEYNYLLEVRIPRDSTQQPAATARRYGPANP
ncbi:phosphoglycerate mutase family protein [Hymenobacter endophyticus]|uniref:Phosphoglycerate mutase family protein n=1 Tax=Hymenobacter endophyticus TaxID=3076335 RepID=A0ABU3TFV5_9BACT|nr:phosphoglycerate mutase family protein [Hymenobacter endophyticus]MDU0370252.1 phosphoglycerate mutase family protein [Hymenobacter endophyticus]